MGQTDDEQPRVRDTDRLRVEAAGARPGRRHEAQRADRDVREVVEPVDREESEQIGRVTVHQAVARRVD